VFGKIEKHLFGFVDIYINKIRFVMEISKEKLLSVLSENNYISDIEEMAKYWTKKVPGKRVASSKLYDNDGNLIGYDMMVDPFSDDPDSDRVQIVFTCDIQKFMEEHPDVVEKLKNDYGTFRWADTKCPSDRPHRDVRVGNPLPGEEGEPIRTIKQTSKDVSTGEKIAGSKKIKTLFLKVLRDNLTRSGDNFNKVLNQRSVPAIALDNRKYFNRHTDEWTNDLIDFSTLSYNVYKSNEEFNQMVADRIFGEETPEMDTEHLARRFNTQYQNWDAEEKKGSTRDFGVTDVYNLRKYGYKEGQENEVFLEMKFDVKGELINNTFVWSIVLVNKFARRKPGESRINGRLEPVEYNPGSLVDGKQISAIKNIQLQPNTQFTPENTIMDNPQIVQGLVDVIKEFKDKIKSISPESVLRKATPTRSELQRGDGGRRRVNENTIDNIIKDVIRESKVGYEVYHNSYTSAINAAKEYAEKRGYEISDDESFTKIGMGPKKPSEGKTNRFSLDLTKDGKEQKKKLHIQVYGMKSKYELNAYIN
jgi:hypothetical protein